MHDPIEPDLTSGEISRLAATLDVWHRNHAEPGTIAVSFGALGRGLTPKEMATHMRNHALGDASPESLCILRLVRYGLEVQTFEEILLSFLGETDRDPSLPREPM